VRTDLHHGLAGHPTPRKTCIGRPFAWLPGRWLARSTSVRDFPTLLGPTSRTTAPSSTGMLSPPLNVRCAMRNRAGIVARLARARVVPRRRSNPGRPTGRAPNGELHGGTLPLVVSHKTLSRIAFTTPSAPGNIDAAVAPSRARHRSRSGPCSAASVRRRSRGTERRCVPGLAEPVDAVSVGSTSTTTSSPARRGSGASSSGIAKARWRCPSRRWPSSPGRWARRATSSRGSATRRRSPTVLALR
jgi:hypothetical protein